MVEMIRKRWFPALVLGGLAILLGAAGSTPTDADAIVLSRALVVAFPEGSCQLVLPYDPVECPAHHGTLVDAAGGRWTYPGGRRPAYALCRVRMLDLGSDRGQCEGLVRAPGLEVRLRLYRLRVSPGSGDAPRGILPRLCLRQWPAADRQPLRPVRYLRILAAAVRFFLDPGAPQGGPQQLPFPVPPGPSQGPAPPAAPRLSSSTPGTSPCRISSPARPRARGAPSSWSTPRTEPCGTPGFPWPAPA